MTRDNVGMARLVRRTVPVIAILASLSVLILGSHSADAASQSKKGRKATSRACLAATPAAIETALGVSKRTYVDGPNVFEPQTCSWRTVEPNCFLRSVSVHLHARAEDRSRIAHASETSLAMGRDYALGNGAFFQTEDLPPGSAVVMEHLFVRNGKNWIEYTLLGRLSLEGARAMLGRLAQSVVLHD